LKNFGPIAVTIAISFLLIAGIETLTAYLPTIFTGGHIMTIKNFTFSLINSGFKTVAALGANILAA
jgi:hypothetical protein